MNKSEIKQLATNTADLKNIKEDIKDIKSEVTNHIPTQIRNLDRKLATVIAIVGILQAIMFLLINKYI